MMSDEQALLAVDASPLYLHAELMPSIKGAVILGCVVHAQVVLC